MTTRISTGLLNSNAQSSFGSFRNKIINGDFNVWQRGTSFASAANGAYTADRWFNNKVGAMVHTISRSTDVPTVAQAGRLFNYSILVDCTTVDSSIAAGDFCAIVQRVEGYNWLPLAQRTFTLSFWVKATKTGTYCVGFTNSGGDRSYTAEYTVNATNAWEYKTVTVTASPSAGTWDYTNGIGLNVRFVLACGSTFQTTAGSWASGEYYATSNQVNACDDTANDFRICGVQLEAGSAATSFDARPFVTELTLCQRYYVNYGYPDYGSTIGMTCDVTSGTNYHFSFQFPVSMRASPSMTWTEWTSSRFPSSDATFQQSGIGGVNVYKNANSTGAGGYFLGGYKADIEL